MAHTHHDRTHQHGHPEGGHTHGPASFGGAFAVGIALTAHLARPGCPVHDALAQRASEARSRHYGIDRATFQIERGEDGRCPQAACQGAA